MAEKTGENAERGGEGGRKQVGGRSPLKEEVLVARNVPAAWIDVRNALLKLIDETLGSQRKVE